MGMPRALLEPEPFLLLTLGGIPCVSASRGDSDSEREFASFVGMIFFLSVSFGSNCRPMCLGANYQKFPGVVRGGCKGSAGPREPKRSYTGAIWGCTGAKHVLDGTTRLLETFLP